MPLPRLADAEERLDQPGHHPDTLARSLRHVAEVNRWLGARRALLRHVGPWIEAGARTVLDVGLGSGDLPRALGAWARRLGRRVDLVGVDAHPQITAVAARTCGFPVLVADAGRLPFRDRAFDVVLLSMTLHHANGNAGVAMLRETARVARRHLFVGELRRARAHYLGARLLAGTIWRRNPLTRNDGPLSVLRGFTPDELEGVAAEAGLERVEVRRHWFYRLVLTAEL